MKNTKRLLTVLLAAALLTILLPITALAAGLGSGYLIDWIPSGLGNDAIGMIAYGYVDQFAAGDFEVSVSGGIVSAVHHCTDAGDVDMEYNPGSTNLFDFTFYETLGSTLPNTRYVWQSATSPNNNFNGNDTTRIFNIFVGNPVSGPNGPGMPIYITYIPQYKVTFDASENVKTDSTAVILTVNGSAKTAGDLPYTTDWINAGDTLTYAYSDSVAAAAGQTNTRYSWTSSGGLGQSGQSDTLTVNSAGTVTGVYTKQYQAAVEQTSHGTITPPTGYFDQGADQTFTITPDAGYHIVGVAADGVERGAQVSWKFTNIQEPHTITASYAADIFALTYGLDSGAVSPANPASYTIESEAITLSNPTRTGYNFTGWSGTDIAGMSASVTIPSGSVGSRSYTANWTASVTGLPATYTMYRGGRVTWDPQPSGGVWNWDHSFFSATFNSPATFTALKTGTSTITYTAGGAAQSITVTIRKSVLPQTGQNGTLPWALVLTAILCGGLAVYLRMTVKR